MTTINELRQEYVAWNRANGLELGSADKHLFDESLTEEQRKWLRSFSERWTQVVARGLRAWTESS